MAKIINNYAKIVAEKPILILVLSLFLTAFLFYNLTNIEITERDFEDNVPADLDIVKAIDIIKNEFSGAESALIVIQIDSSFPNLNEPIDVRDPNVIMYIDILTQKVKNVDYVEDVFSISEIVKGSNNGYVPNSLRSIKTSLENNPFVENYVSEDNSMSLIKISLNEDAKNDVIELERQLSELIKETKVPSGVSVQLAGEVIRSPTLSRLIAPDMQRTSLFALVGIFVILLFLLKPAKYSFLALATILFGTVWALGFVGLINFGISSSSAGVISMIMGIGIDFGIQIITRFKHELKDHEKRRAMEITIRNVFMPMLTTTLAALIGFRAMSLGQLTVMSEMGTIMSYGVAFSMLAAITIVPSLLVLLEKDK